jgi:hypothetical protein
MDELQSRLALRPDQIQKLDVILEQTHQRFKGLREKYRPEVKIIQEEQASSVRSILDPQQVVEYEKMRQERERQHQQKHGHPPGC